MGNCPACGEAATGDSMFCVGCGARLPTASTPASSGSSGTGSGSAGPTAPSEWSTALPDAWTPGHATSPTPASPTPDRPAFTDAPHPAQISPGGGPQPPVLHTSTRGLPSVPVLVIAAIVALVVAALLVTSLGGGGDDEVDLADEAPTTTLPPLSTTPILTDEQYLVDVVASDRGTSPLSLDTENECYYRSLIAAMGGAAGLRSAGIPPDRLTDPFVLRGEAVPPDAVDTFLSTNSACGLDLTEVILVRPLGIEEGDAVAACVGAGIDRATLNRIIAEFFLNPNRSDLSFVPPPALSQQLLDLDTACS